MLRRLRDTHLASWIPGRERRVAQAGAVAAAGLVLVALWQLWAEVYAIFGVDEGVTLDAVKIVVADTPWGTAWIARLAITAAALGAFLWAGARPRIGWWLAAATAAAVAASLTLTGHTMSASSRGLSTVLQAAHVLGAGLWIGGLLTIVVFGLLAHDPAERHTVAPLLVGTFSPLALTGVVSLAGTGVVTAFLYLEAPSQLWATWYGRALLFKLVLFVTAAALGAYNWRRLTPRLAEPDATRAMVRSAGLELAVAAAVLAVTSILVSLPLEP